MVLLKLTAASSRVFPMEMRGIVVNASVVIDVAASAAKVTVVKILLMMNGCTRSQGCSAALRLQKA